MGVKKQFRNFCVKFTAFKHESVPHEHRATKRGWYSMLVKRLKKFRFVFIVAIV